MKPFLKFILISISILTLNACNYKVLKKDMVLFDKAFIPVLYAVHLGDMDSAEQAMIQLDKEWQRIKKEYPLTSTGNIDRSTLKHRGDLWLTEAECAIKDGEIEHALIQLDHMRYEWMDLRFRNDIDYFLDDVWDFEATLDIATQTAYDPMIDLRDWKEFVSECYDMKDAWEMVLINKETLNDFSLSKEQETRIINHHFKMNKEVDEFLTVVEVADLDLVREKIDTVKKQYLTYIQMFSANNKTESFLAKL